MQAENKEDHRHWCQEELETRKDKEYVSGKAITHLSGKVIELNRV